MVNFYPLFWGGWKIEPLYFEDPILIIFHRNFLFHPSPSEQLFIGIKPFPSKPAFFLGMIIFLGTGLFLGICLIPSETSSFHWIGFFSQNRSLSLKIEPVWAGADPAENFEGPTWKRSFLTITFSKKFHFLRQFSFWRSWPPRSAHGHLGRKLHHWVPSCRHYPKTAQYFLNGIIFRSFE